MNKLKNKYQPAKVNAFRNLAEQNYALEFIRWWRLLTITYIPITILSKFIWNNFNEVQFSNKRKSPFKR